MTEEVKPQEGQEQVEAPAHTEIELKAMEMGWRPKEEFQGDEDDFIDAKEFVRRKPLFDKIDHQGRQLKALTKAMEGLKNHYSTMREVEYERALKAVKAERKQALVDGDGDRFEELDEQIKTIEQQAASAKAMREAPIVQEEAQPPQEFINWKNRNSWYESTTYMRKFADEVGLDLHSRGMSPSEVLKKVEEAVRKEFPHKFTNPNKANAPDVATPNGSAKGKAADRDVELSDMERKVMNDLVRAGVLTKEQYLKDIKAKKGIA